MKDATQPLQPFERYVLPLAMCAAAAVVVLIGLFDHAHIFETLLPNQGGDKDLGGFDNAINKVKGPINAAFAATVPIGLAAGGGLMAIGSQKGLPVIVSSAGAGAIVLLGNGLLQ
jgi:hypothetical protein